MRAPSTSEPISGRLTAWWRVGAAPATTAASEPILGRPSAWGRFGACPARRAGFADGSDTDQTWPEPASNDETLDRYEDHELKFNIGADSKDLDINTNKAYKSLSAICDLPSSRARRSWDGRLRGAGASVRR